MGQETKLIVRDDTLVVESGNEQREISIYSEEGFKLLSHLWIKSGWHQRYSYMFTWLGRPVIQLPEDLLVIQEIIFTVQPSVIIETGVAHGGSLIFYASLCKILGKGRVIGVDIEIRPHNRAAIQEHSLFPYITLIEGNSVAAEVIDAIQAQIKPDESVLVLLDSDHSKKHVLAELNAYAPLVTPGSYIVATDGIMQELAGGPRAKADWSWDNPQEAVRAFAAQNPAFVPEVPPLRFDESTIHLRNTYWPNAYLKRI